MFYICIKLLLSYEIDHFTIIYYNCFCLIGIRYPMVCALFVWHVSMLQISKLCPIDLVIGGSPCNEFSIANPARKGLDSRSSELI